MFNIDFQSVNAVTSLILIVAGMDGQMRDGADMGEFFLLGILVGVFCVVAEFGVSAGHLVDVLKQHQCEPVHKGTSWSKKNLLLFYIANFARTV